MPYDPKAIANFFIEAAAREGRKLTPLQVIKLVYIAHGKYLAANGKPLINEHPEAWEFGPVIPSLYHEFKLFGKGPITTKATEVVKESGKIKEIEVPAPDPTEDEQTVDFLTRIWDEYGNFSGYRLSSLTHQPGTPWHTMWNKRGQYAKGVDIPEDLITRHYKELNDRDGATARRP